MRRLNHTQVQHYADQFGRFLNGSFSRLIARAPRATLNRRALREEGGWGVGVVVFGGDTTLYPEEVVAMHVPRVIVTRE